MPFTVPRDLANNDVLREPLQGPETCEFLPGPRSTSYYKTRILVRDYPGCTSVNLPSEEKTR